MPNFMRFAIGTLTRITVPAPDSVNRHVASRAMATAPVVGLLIALLIGIPLVALTAATQAGDDIATSFVIATLAIGASAWLTRGLHLDGLADTADALGSGRPAEQALEIARRSDIGPFGVLAIVFALLLQVAGLTAAISAGHGFLALVIAVVGGRVAITIACMRGIPAARPDGLGAVVAQSVSPVIATLWAVALVFIAAGLAVAEATPPVAPVAAAISGLLAAIAVLVVARRRLGGITGDVIGATVEVSTAATLMVLGLAIA